MRGTALAISLALGTIGFAPVARADDPPRGSYGDRWRDDRYDRDRYDRYDRYDRRDRYDRYDDRYDNGRDARPLVTMGISRSQRVTINQRAGRFSRLRLQAVRGQPYIDFVYLVFRGGETQRIDINRPLVEGESLDLDLLGRRRAITSITIGGRPDRWSRVTVVGVR
ncbi:MAG: hypothetical protein AB7P03_07815 [Kofleriaceae bacterium]